MPGNHFHRQAGTACLLGFSISYRKSVPQAARQIFTKEEVDEKSTQAFLITRATLLAVKCGFCRMAAGLARDQAETPVVLPNTLDRDLKISVAHEAGEFLTPLDKENCVLRQQVVQS